MVEQLSLPDGYEVVGFQDSQSALEAAQHKSPSLIIADYHLETMTFTGFCKEVYKQDNLTETDIVTLVSSSDRVDESHLRTLGVKALITKPFQPENLIAVITDLTAQQISRKNGVKKKSRSWPPASSGADDDDAPETVSSQSKEVLQTVSAQPQPKDIPVTPSTATQATNTEPEEAMKGLFGQLLQSMSERTEKKIADMLPQMMGKEMATLVAKAVEAEVRAHIGAALTPERLSQVLEPLLMQTIPKVLAQEMTLLEPIIRHSIADMAKPFMTQTIDQLTREQTAAVRTALPEMVREQIRSFEELIKEEIQKTAAKQTAGIVEELVRSAAYEQIEQAVQHIVPDLATAQIKTEIARLTAAA